MNKKTGSQKKPVSLLGTSKTTDLVIQKTTNKPVQRIALTRHVFHSLTIANGGACPLVLIQLALHCSKKKPKKKPLSNKKREPSRYELRSHLDMDSKEVFLSQKNQLFSFNVLSTKTTKSSLSNKP